MAGQSIIDRVTSARHSIAGHGLAKSVCKSTTEEVMGPKKKHLDYLLQCTNEPNVSIPQMADLLIERTQHGNWVVVFKSLISIHNLMNYGNERFTQYLASNNCSFNLGNFLDKTGVQGYDMSTFIRRYAKYLNEKAVSYRQMAFDFCKVKRGKEDGMLRTMNGEKLLKTLPSLQAQLDALLELDVSPNELTNGVINACFMLMFKDLIRLFACYNDGIINLLEKYFEMNKKNCRDALDIYKRFLVRMDKVSEFLKTAENVGIDKGDIPDLAKAPSSLLDALEQHLLSLESAKKAGGVPAPKPGGVTTAINTLIAANDANAAQITEEEKRRILEEESQRLQEIKEQKLKEAASTNPFNTPDITASYTPTNVDLFGTTSPVTSPGQTGKSGDDLLSLAGPNPFTQPVISQQQQPVLAMPATNLFASPVSTSADAPVPAPWGNPAVPTGSTATVPVTNNHTGFASDAQFAQVFGNGTSNTGPGFDGFGEVMRPLGGVPQPRQEKSGEKLIVGDLDTSLASLAGNLNINGPAHQVKKPGHNWTYTGKKKKVPTATLR